MNIIVCVKQVPDIAELRVNYEKKTYWIEKPFFIINPFDEFAVEESIRIKEKLGGKVTVVSIGPESEIELLNRCIAMGADDTILLDDKNLIGSDTLTISYVLSKIIEKLKFDVIFCGQQSIDTTSSNIGPQVAEFLDIPQVTFVNKVEILSDKEKQEMSDKLDIIVHKETDYGHNIIKCSTPLLLTVTKGINEPRYPSFPNLLKAKKGNFIKKISLDDIGCNLNDLNNRGIKILNISPYKHRERKSFTIDSSLSPQDRMKLIMSGGMVQKDNTTIVEDKPDRISEKLIDYLKREKII